MKQHPQHDLIDAWLAGRADGQARKALARELTENPGAVSELVDQARAEASLRTHFVPVPLAAAARTALAARRPARSRWLLASCAAAVAAISLAIFLTAPPAVHPRQNGISRRSPERLKARHLFPSAANEKQQTSAAAGTEGKHHLEALLNGYWLNGNGLRSPMKLSLAAKELSRSIQQANVLKRPELSGVSIEVVRPDDMADEPVVILTDRNLTAGRALRLLAAQANAKIAWQESKVILTLTNPPPDTGVLRANRVYRVGPQFLSILGQLNRPPVEKPGAADPFTPVPESLPQIQGLLATDTFAELAGLQRSRGAAWSYNPEQSTVHLNLTPAEHQRAVSLLDALNESAGAGQILTTWKFIDVPDGLKVEERIMDNEAFQLFARGMLGMKGVDVASYPSVISLNLQSVTMESTEDVPVPANDGETAFDFTGFRMVMTPALTGDSIVLEGTADIGLPKDNAVQHMIVDISATLQEGQTAVFLFPSTRPGRQTVGTVEVRQIDASGQSQDGQTGKLPLLPDPFANQSGEAPSPRDPLKK